MKKEIGLRPDWGFACLIESNYDTILFDTGAKGNILLYNMNILDRSPNKLAKIVVSNEHKDHTGGIQALGRHIRNIELCRMTNKAPNHELKMTIPTIPQEISENIWTTGQLKGIVDEQSLVLRGRKGWHILADCSHPNIINILQVAQQIGPIVGIVGGFHGLAKFPYLKNFDMICPCHCTAHKDALKKMFPNSYSVCGVGKVIDVNVGI